MPRPTSRGSGELAIVAALAASYILITALLSFGPLTTLDLAIRDGLRENAPEWLVMGSQVVAYLGQGGPWAGVVLLVALIQTLRLRTIRPILLWLLSFALLIVMVAPVKIWSRRGAPNDELPGAVEFFSRDFCGSPACQSYPSGHVANAILWCGLLFVLIQPTPNRAQWIVRFTIGSFVAVATIVSGYHWMTDTVAGILAGLLAYMIIRHAQDTERRFLSTIDRILFHTVSRSSRSPVA